MLILLATRDLVSLRMLMLSVYLFLKLSKIKFLGLKEHHENKEHSDLDGME